MKQVVGAAEAGKQFIAITDPGSKMQQVAEADGFRHIFFGLAEHRRTLFGALRISAWFPARFRDWTFAKLLDRTEEMVHACASVVPADENPGAILGRDTRHAAKSGPRQGDDSCFAGNFDLGAWLEQLLAESTGKEGKGLIPVDREEIGSPDVYGKDRVFAYLRLETAPDPKQDAAVAALEQAGHPVVRIAVPDIYGLGQEIFRWEIATAVAGSVIGINAFNQPDVEASKIETRKLTEQYEKTGSLPPESPFFADADAKLFTDEKNAAALKQSGRQRRHIRRLLARTSQPPSRRRLLRAARLHPDERARTRMQLQSIRHAVRDKKRVATCLGFGPRFLHSTGQAYKGGPNSGVFLQITCDDAADLPVPGQKYTFGIVKAAQARGDFQVLADRGRRALRIHLGTDVAAGLAKLQQAIRQALS